MAVRFRALGGLEMARQRWADAEDFFLKGLEVGRNGGDIREMASVLANWVKFMSSKKGKRRLFKAGKRQEISLWKLV